jgi:hypothetical protein
MSDGENGHGAFRKEGPLLFSPNEGLYTIIYMCLFVNEGDATSYFSGGMPLIFSASSAVCARRAASLA